MILVKVIKYTKAFFQKEIDLLFPGISNNETDFIYTVYEIVLDSA